VLLSSWIRVRPHERKAELQDLGVVVEMDMVFYVRWSDGVVSRDSFYIAWVEGRTKKKGENDRVGGKLGGGLRSGRIVTEETRVEEYKRQECKRKGYKR
jgi:hypothetical protein